jgi:hypothetical protein
MHSTRRPAYRPRRRRATSRPRWTCRRPRRWSTARSAASTPAR